MQEHPNSQTEEWFTSSALKNAFAQSQVNNKKPTLKELIKLSRKK